MERLIDTKAIAKRKLKENKKKKKRKIELDLINVFEMGH